MNDLTFGATLLSLLATVVVAAVVEVSAPAPTSKAIAAAVAARGPAGTVRAAGGKECTTVALAPTGVR
jgi:hypothetical protein